MFFHAAQEGILDPEHSIQVGLRSFNPKSHGFHRLSVEFVHEMGVAATIEEIEKVVGDRPAYLSFDIDAGSGLCAGHWHTGKGLSSWQAISLIRKLGVNLIGADLAEVSLPFDHAEITSLAGATLLMESSSMFGFTAEEG